MRRDAIRHVIDEQTQMAPHVMPPPFLVDSNGNAYCPALQTLVPGRENLPYDQQLPTLIVNGNGRLEIVADTVQVPPPIVTNINTSLVQCPKLALKQNNIQKVIVEYNDQKEMKISQSHSSTNIAAKTSVATESRLPISTPLHYDMYSGDAISETVNTSTGAATTDESILDVHFRVIVKPLTSGQLASEKREKEGCAEKELTLFCQEANGNAINIGLDSSVSQGIAALLATRSHGVNSDGWEPVRTRCSLPRTFTRRKRKIVDSTARSTTPSVFRARRSATGSHKKATHKHNYQTRANRAKSDTRLTHNGMTLASGGTADTKTVKYGYYIESEIDSPTSEEESARQNKHNVKSLKLNIYIYI